MYDNNNINQENLDNSKHLNIVNNTGSNPIKNNNFLNNNSISENFSENCNIHR